MCFLSGVKCGANGLRTATASSGCYSKRLAQHSWDVRGGGEGEYYICS